MNAQQRIELIDERMTEYMQQVQGKPWSTSISNVLVSQRGWTAFIDGRKVAENLPTLEDALRAAEHYVDRITDSDALLAKTLGIAS